MQRMQVNISSELHFEAGNILVVDDEVLIREIVEAHLEDHGYQCKLAKDSDEAKALLKKESFDACFIDVHMPGESGMDLLAHICGNYPDTVSIMLTGERNTAMAVVAMKMGAYDYVTKPFQHDDLLIRLHQALEKRQLKLQNRLYRERLEELVKVRTEALHERNEQLKRLSLNTIESFVLTLQMRNAYTEGHSQRVAYWCVCMARAMEMDSTQQLAIYHAALLHDMGKMAVQDAILEKPGPLTPEEYLDIQRHPLVACDILQPIVQVVEEFHAVVEAIRYHHEHYDGSGYPCGLRGEEIPLSARIIAVADAYDSMASSRAYRTTMPADEVIEELARCAGSQFDPTVVDVFIRSCRQTGTHMTAMSGEIFTTEPWDPFLVQKPSSRVPIDPLQEDAESRKRRVG